MKYLYILQKQNKNIAKRNYFFLLICLLSINSIFAQQPVVNSFYPTYGGAGSIIGIYGNNLTAVTAVSFGGVPAASFTVDSSGYGIIAVVGAGATGDISVTTALGTSSISGFLFVQKPKIISFSPTSGTVGTIITIKGLNFTDTPHVTFGGVRTVQTTAIGDTMVNVAVGNGASGNIILTTVGGSDTISGFTFGTPQPTISGFSPTSAGSGGVVRITGTNLNYVTSVSFGGVPATSFSFAGSTVINAAVGSGATGDVSVTSAGGTTTLAGFTFIPSAVINSFSPTSALPGTTITIKGKNFTNASSVSFGGTAATSFSVVSDSVITAIVAYGSSSGNVIVTAQQGNGSLAGFVYIIPLPTITSFTPSIASSGTTVTITGTNFTGATSVKFGNDTAASFSVISSTTITAVLANGASGNVSVTTAGGTASLPGFIYGVPPPTITSFTPSIGGSGTTITITGTNFTGATSVTFGNDTVTSFSIVSSTTITAVLANGASGNVSVTTPGGTASLQGFTYVPAPIINSFAPASAGIGDTITIKGLSLAYTSTLNFGGLAAASFIIQSDSVIKAVVGLGNSGSVSITTAYGNASLAGFIFVPTIQIYSFSPTSAQQGTSVTIHGRSFSNASSVSFGGKPATSFIIISDSIITATVGSGSSGNISVVLGSRTASISGFIFMPPTAISSFFPVSGAAGTVITIHGVSFTGTTSVSIGGVPAASYTVVSDTVVTAIVGNGSSADVTLLSPQGSATLSGFTFLSVPSITSFYPTSGPIGTTVTITGINFDPSTSNNIVFFGGVQASIISASTDTIVVKAPAGTTFQPISVSTHSLTAYSNKPFALTFPNGGSIDSNSFAAPKNFAVDEFSSNLSIGDLDGDGKLDVATVQTNYGGITTFRNVSTDTIGLIQKKMTLGIQGPGNILIGDLNADGKLDAMLITNANSQVALDLSVNKSTLGNIVMSGASQYFMAGAANAIGIADLDGDGRPDMISTNASFNSMVSVFRSTIGGNTGSFSKRLDFTTNKQPYGLAIADIDGDGKPDMVVSNSTGTISIFLNTSSVGNISFATKIDFVTGNNPLSVSAADIDGDGKPDVIVVNQKDSSVSIFRNTSSIANISFASRIDFATGTINSVNASPQLLATGDLDGDGKPELAFACVQGISVLKNTSSPGLISFAPKVTYKTTKSPLAISIGDMDNDGKQDLIYIALGYTVSILKNQVSQGPQPAIISFAPTSAKSGDTTIISGTHFSSTNTVNFGGVAASSFSIISDSIIKAIVGNGSSGSVTVTTSAGTASKDGFVFIAPTSTIINSFSPDSAAAGTTVTIKGKNFTGASFVSFGDVPASSFNVVSDSVITAIVGNGKSGDVIVIAVGSDTASGFTFIESSKTPTIISFTPDSGGTGSSITIKGKNFTGATQVIFGDSIAASFNVISDSVITAIVGNGSSGNIIVKTSNGTDTISGFTFIPKSNDSLFRLIQFSGVIMNEQAILNWQTVNEQGVSSFVIQHGADSIHFADIAIINATGGVGPYNYGFPDMLPQYQNNYYRLKIINNTEDSTFSKAIYLQLENNPQGIKAYPNPAKDYVIIDNPVSTFTSYIEIIDLSGQTVKKVQVNPGVVQTKIDISTLTSGIYIIIWSDGAKPSSLQLQIIH